MCVVCDRRCRLALHPPSPPSLQTNTHPHTHPAHGGEIGVGARAVEARGKRGEVVEGVDVVAC